MATAAPEAGSDASAREKSDRVWSDVLSSGPGPGSYPDAKALAAYGKDMDYASLLDYTDDVQPPGRKKVMCSAGGAVAPVRFEWRQQAREHFTGLFRGADHGLIRCSSVIEPSAPSSWSPVPAMIPMVALKFFRDGSAPSGNVVLAHKKSGGKDVNFLKYAVSNHFTENVRYPFKAALAVFQKYSQFPTFTGLADFASMTQDGAAEEKVVAPYALVLVAPAELQSRQVAMSVNLADQLGSLAAGDVLYEAYAVPEPLHAGLGQSATKPCRCSEVVGCPNKPAIWRIGELRLVAPFVSSSYGDSQLFFRHTLVDRDLEIRRDWAARIDTMLGAPFYHSIIQAGDIWDPEAPPPKEPIQGESMLDRAKTFKEQEEREEEELAVAISQTPSELREALEESGLMKAEPRRRGACCPFGFSRRAAK